MLSELDESVLKAVMLGNKSIWKISKASGIPPLLAEKIVERLIERNYVNMDFEPTEKAYREIKWLDRKHGFSFYGEDVRKIIILIVDLAITIGVIVLLSTLLYFLGFGG
ncbi:MAG TPA: hypothetical protein EYP30_06415 [Archaeoglobaceae archaeon]|nr:hypothetical protein [Archaeoglobaceae archaeon]